MSDTFTPNLGSDLTFAFNWSDGAGGNADLTGFTADATDLSPGFEAADITVSLTDAAEGEITVSVPWAADRMSEGTYFRVRITSADGERTTTNRLWIAYR
jgi:hypothetical protein